MSSLNAAQVAFAQKMFELYESFLPTRALYVDLEGSGGGIESIASFYWPQNSRSERFTWSVRTPTDPISMSDIQATVADLGLVGSEPGWVVTYAQGRYASEERERIIELLGGDPWPNAVWVNLLHVFQECPEMTRSIKEHRNVRFKRDRTRIRRSLESLEWEFGIVRDPSIRSHSNQYSDGAEGEISVLSLAKQFIQETISQNDLSSLENYCRQDVESMLKISRMCERGMFDRRERARRYREYSTI
jgi:hypothetical protein